MPDNIATINGKVAMAYQNEIPWHKLGVKRQKLATVDEALVAANLNWNVQLKQMFWLDTEPDADDPVDENDFKIVPKRHAVIRDVDSVCLGTVGDSYTPLQNRAAFSILDIACKEFGVTIETAGALGKGEKVWMLAKMEKTIEVVPGDNIDSYFLVATGHDGSTPLTARPTPVRVVCQNTIDLAMAGTPAIIRLTHGQNLDHEVKQAKQMVTALILMMQRNAVTFRQLAERRMTPFEVRQYVDDVLSIETGAAVSAIIEKRRAKIINLVYQGKGVEFAPETAWTAFNAVTEYVDHVRPAEIIGDQLRKVNESALFGTNSWVKARALKLAQQLLPA